MADTPTYKSEDIVRYLQRSMSPQEMHAFERALMDDPFLADALEGYQASDPALAAVHLNQLGQQIRGEREKTKVVPLVTKKGRWWKTAAVASFLVAGGALSYWLLREQNAPATIAQEIKTDSTHSFPQSAQAPSAQKPLLKQEESLQQDAGPHVQKPSLPPPSFARSLPAAPAPVEEKADPLMAARPGNTPALMTPDSLATASAIIAQPRVGYKISQPPPTQPVYEFKGRVTDEKGEAIPYATITEQKSRSQFSTDVNGNFKLKDADTVVTITANGVGYVAGVSILRAEKPDTIALAKSNAALSEVVIVGYGSQRKSVVAGGIDSTSAEPIGGWKNFGLYLSRQIDSLQTGERKNRYVSEDVMLEFSVDGEGNPSDIKVPRHTSKAAASQAVQVLTQGPKWKNKKKDKKVKVVIPFGAGK